MTRTEGNPSAVAYHIDYTMSLHEGQIIYATWPHPTKPGVFLSRYGSRMLSVANPNSSIFQDGDKKRLYHTYNNEFIAEKVRKERFPSYPSRFCCLFAARSIDDLLKWKQRLELTGTIRICEIEYPAGLFEFDARLLDGLILNQECLLSEESAFTQYEIEAEKQIIDYWSGKKTESPLNEVLVPFPARVLKIYTLNC